MPRFTFDFDGGKRTVSFYSGDPYAYVNMYHGSYGNEFSGLTHEAAIWLRDQLIAAYPLPEKQQEPLSLYMYLGRDAE